MVDKIIKVNNISYTYPDSKKAAISNISFELKRGSWMSIIGRNGSGKSTLTKLLNGLLAINDSKTGFIEIDGIRLSEETVWEVRDKIGIVFQNPDNQFVGATVADDVAFGLENRGVPRDQMIEIVSRMIDEVGMSDYKNSEPASLSGGQKQRVAIAGILAIKPKIIILDEATAMLDPAGRNHILKIARRMQKEENLTVLAITHDPEEIKFADEVMVMNEGKVLKQGSPRQVTSDVALLKKLGLEVPFSVQIKDELNSDGMSIPDTIFSEEELVEYLCQLNSKK